MGGINVAGAFMFKRAGRDNGVLGAVGCCGVGVVTG